MNCARCCDDAAPAPMGGVSTSATHVHAPVASALAHAQCRHLGAPVPMGWAAALAARGRATGVSALPRGGATPGSMSGAALPATHDHAPTLCAPVHAHEAANSTLLSPSASCAIGDARMISPASPSARLAPTSADLIGPAVFAPAEGGAQPTPLASTPAGAHAPPAPALRGASRPASNSPLAAATPQRLALDATAASPAQFCAASTTEAAVVVGTPPPCGASGAHALPSPCSVCCLGSSMTLAPLWMRWWASSRDAAATP